MAFKANGVTMVTVLFNTKCQQLSNELVRRLSRCHKDLEESESPNVINRYEEKLRYSGYDKQKRLKIIDQGIGAFNVKKRRNNQRIFKTAKETAGKRRMKKIIGKESWYKPWVKPPGIFTQLRKEGRTGGRMAPGKKNPQKNDNDNSKENKK